MIMGVSRDVFREMIHWLWLWMLAAIAVSLGQSIANGGGFTATQVHQTLIKQSRTPPIRVPEIQLPDEFRYPFESIETDHRGVHDVIRLNHAGEFESVIEVWEKLRLAEDSQTWKHVGLGAAYLRLNQLEKALEQLSQAIQLDPENAVAEYFLGRVRQAQNRRIPFWYEQNRDDPFRLAGQSADQGVQADEGVEGRFFLPHFKNPQFEKMARAHFRRAITLAASCDLNRRILVLRPEIQLVSGQTPGKPITIRDLLISLGEENYVEKARHEVELRFIQGDPHSRIGRAPIINLNRFH